MEIINNSQIVECWGCDGFGAIRPSGERCSICKGSGKYQEDHYFYVFEDEHGNKIAIDGDQGGK